MTSRILYKFSFLCLLLFILFSYTVLKGVWVNFDYQTTIYLQHLFGRFVDIPFSILSIIGSAEVTFFIWGIIVVCFFIKKERNILLGLSLFPFIILIEILFKNIVSHPGPPDYLQRTIHFIHLFSENAPVPYSYPSGHVLRTTFLIMFLTSLANKKIQKPIISVLLGSLILILILMIISRVYLGEHWTSDVVGGLLLGSAFGLLAIIPLQNNLNHQAD